MARQISLYTLAALALGAAACTPAAETPAKEPESTTTIVETREVQVPPVVIEREVQSPPVVIERDRRDGDSTTVRAGEGGIEVETTNR